MNYCIWLLRSALIPCLLVFGSFSLHAETNPRFYAVEVSASVQASPAQITLRWTTDANATGYNVYRKAPNATSWTQLTSLAGSATTWSDGNVSNGGSYEYAITKSTSAGYQGTGYVLAGINAPMVENRGKMLLIVDDTHAAALATELTRLQQDLVGDGWTVIRHDVSRSATPPTIKNLIKNAYNSDPANVKSVFLFGHVAVPYSGNNAVDGHPDHRGAWVADTYYGDMDGIWTDFSVNNTGAEKAWNRNVPGDGKFDQSDLPSDLELAVGRVDLFNMTCYANKSWSRSELDLLRAYLNKDHNFRHGRIAVPRRGLVCDNFGEVEGEAFASTGWRSFASFFGAENNLQVPYGAYFSTLRDNAYLWSYGTGGGSWYTCNGIGSSDDFANTEIKTVFTAFLGSYFGDWDNESAFLRAPLGSGYALATAWGGRPHWFFHPMGLGETIGSAAKLSQNNRYGGIYGAQNWGTRQTHVTLLGDPSLRMHPVIPPANVLVNGGTITWTASTETAIQGYQIYRGSSANGPFTKISGSSPIANLFFSDPAPVSGSVYMVRAVKLEQSGSGTYLNLSQGAFSGSVVPNPNPNPTAPAAPSNLGGTALSSTQIKLQWTDNSTDETGFRLQRKAGASGSYTTLSIGANATSYTDSNLTAGTQYFYKMHAYNAAGSSASTPEISVITQSTVNFTTNSAVSVKTDATTGGNWRAVYGEFGGIAPWGYLPQPSFLKVSGRNNLVWAWNSTLLIEPALQKASGSDRIPMLWYHHDFFEFDLQFFDSAARLVSFYFFDFSAAGRQQKLEFFDLSTGTLLGSATIKDFSTGVYSSWSLKGKLRVRVTREAGANCVLSGIFFDENPLASPKSSVHPSMSPHLDGTWKGVIGNEGYLIAGEGKREPTYATSKLAGAQEHVWNWSTVDPVALQKTSAPDRLASCWYSSGQFELSVDCSPALTHTIAFYFLDWDNAKRVQRVDATDPETGVLLYTATISDFQDGVYLVCEVRGPVVFRFTSVAGPNAVLSGLFFDRTFSGL